MFWFPLTSIASFWSQFQLGLAAGERVFALIDAEPKVVQTGNEPIPLLLGEIGFEHVDFEYKENEPVLRDFSLTIRAGETLALVGHTGIGQVEHRQADRALLRVPGRADHGRWARYSHPGPGNLPDATWALSRRRRFCLTAR